MVAGTTDDGADLASVRLVGAGTASHVLAGTTGEGAELASVGTFEVGLARHCGSGHDR